VLCDGSDRAGLLYWRQEGVRMQSSHKVGAKTTKIGLREVVRRANDGGPGKGGLESERVEDAELLPANHARA